MALLATAMAQHDFPEKPDAERFAAIARHVMEQDREELDQLMIFIYEELREILDEAWEATADAEG